MLRILVWELGMVIAGRRSERGGSNQQDFSPVSSEVDNPRWQKTLREESKDIDNKDNEDNNDNDHYNHHFVFARFYIV